MFMTNYCRGCYTYIHENGCGFMTCNEDGGCPCVICIVKPMCGKPCPDFKKFRINHKEHRDPI